MTKIEPLQHYTELKEIGQILLKLKHTSDTDGCYNPYNLVYPYIAEVVHDIRELLRTKIEDVSKPQLVLEASSS